ncbi:MAG TPA: SDR family oxidoreductase [Propionibacteriaceae bacterium]|nr:SDR family oxidoreductase [Propionibacteriaceae bacterium]
MTWTLITGASGGIGRAFAAELAARGHDLVLTARREEELRATADIIGAHGVRTELIPADLSDPAGRRHLLDELRARDLTISMLVNNAGFGSIGRFAELDADRLADEVELDVQTVVQLSRALLPAMLDAGHGSIVNVASTAAFQPLPTMAVYAAAKAFVLSFSQALWDEVRHQGVRVIAVCPGPTDTDFFVRAGDDDVLTGRRTPQQVALTCLEALDKGRPYVVDGLLNTVQAEVAKRTPARVAIPLARAVVRHHD